MGADHFVLLVMSQRVCYVINTDSKWMTTPTRPSFGSALRDCSVFVPPPNMQEIQHSIGFNRMAVNTGLSMAP